MTTTIGECCNCGARDVRVLAREDDGGAMCQPCWIAEEAWCVLNMTAEEIEPEYWRTVWQAFEQTTDRRTG